MAATACSSHARWRSNAPAAVAVLLAVACALLLRAPAGPATQAAGDSAAAAPASAAATRCDDQVRTTLAPGCCRPCMASRTAQCVDQLMPDPSPPLLLCSPALATCQPQACPSAAPGGGSGRHARPAAEGLYIVRFHEYRMAADHRAALTQALSAAAPSSSGGWEWVERRNPAAAHPTDFALLRLAAPGEAEIKVRSRPVMSGRRQGLLMPCPCHADCRRAASLFLLPPSCRRGWPSCRLSGACTQSAC